MSSNDLEKTESLGISSGSPELPLSIEGWTQDAARSLLRIGFSAREFDRIIRLESKAAQASLTSSEEAELAGYEQVSVFIELLKRSAQRHLSHSDPDGATLRE